MNMTAYLTAISRVNVDQRVLSRFNRRVRVAIRCVNHLLLTPVHLISTVHYLRHCASFKMHLQCTDVRFILYAKCERLQHRRYL